MCFLGGWGVSSTLDKVVDEPSPILFVLPSIYLPIVAHVGATATYIITE